MLIKLTHRGTPTIVNVNHIVSMFMDTDKKSGIFETKITTTNGIIFVEETPPQIQELSWQALNGDKPNTDYEVPTIEQRMEKSYNNERPLSYEPKGHRTRTPIRRNYNPHNFVDYNY